MRRCRLSYRSRGYVSFSSHRLLHDHDGRRGVDALLTATCGFHRSFTRQPSAGSCSVHPRSIDLRRGDRKSTRLNSSHPSISYAVFCLKKKKKKKTTKSLITF